MVLKTFPATGQVMPDSIVVVSNSYVGGTYNVEERLNDTRTFLIVRQGNAYVFDDKRIAKSRIHKLLSSINSQDNINKPISRYQIDTSRIKNNPGSLLSMYSGDTKYDWNEQQKEFIINELGNLQNYSQELNTYLLHGCCYTMHHSYKQEFILKFFAEGNLFNEIRSRKFVWGYEMPWTNVKGDTLYNYCIEKIFSKILAKKYYKMKAPLLGDKLLKYLVNRIIDNNFRSLQVLAARSYEKEIDELRNEFKVLSAEEIYGRGGDTWDESKIIKTVLQNSQMPDNIRFVFLITVFKNSIYSRDSIRKDYKEYLNKVRSISFINEYLKLNKNCNLDIYYFDNKGINDENIYNVNRDSTKWKRHDEYVESLRWYEKNNIKPGFDKDKAIKISQHNDCGCNYRFDKSYIQKAILFQIKDENGNTSLWFLMPDNKVLLYLMQGKKVLSYSYSDFGDSPGIQWPCILFDLNGNKLTK